MTSRYSLTQQDHQESTWSSVVTSRDPRSWSHMTSCGHQKSMWSCDHTSHYHITSRRRLYSVLRCHRHMASWCCAASLCHMKNDDTRNSFLRTPHCSSHATVAETATSSADVPIVAARNHRHKDSKSWPSAMHLYVLFSFIKAKLYLSLIGITMSPLFRPTEPYQEVARFPVEHLEAPQERRRDREWRDSSPIQLHCMLVASKIRRMAPEDQIDALHEIDQVVYRYEKRAVRNLTTSEHNYS